MLEDKIESDYHSYLGENKIDRVQLYSEIKFHIVAWDEGFFVESANPINLTIKSSGDVVDTRIGIVAKGLYGGEYYE